MTAIANRFDAQEIMLAICGVECPSCEGRKQRGCCFCDKCYAKLSEELKRDVKNAMRVMSHALRNGLTYLEDR